VPNEDDRFGDVAEQLKRTDTAEGSADDATDDGDDDGGRAANEATDDAPSEPAEARDPEPSVVDDDEAADDGGGPAFAFDETSMHGFYVREETWERVTHARSRTNAACSMFDVPEFEGREFQDACLRVVADHADEIALRILEERGVDADEERVREVVVMLSAGD
jgi:hypothetical protein